MKLTRMKMGPWELIMGDEKVVLTPGQVRTLEETLTRYIEVATRTHDYGQNFAMKRWGVPSLVVRFDMAPMRDDTELGIYEIEANTAGLGFLKLAGIPADRIIAQALQKHGISAIAMAIAESRATQGAELRFFMEDMRRHGLTVTEVSCDEQDLNGTPIWLRAGEEDHAQIRHLEGSSILLYRDGGGHKIYLLDLGGGKLLSEFSSVDAFFAAYSDGFTIKPWRSWGTKEVFFYVPEQPWKKMGWTEPRARTAIGSILTDPSEAKRFVAQPFFAPGLREEATPSEKPGQTGKIKRFCRAWRVCAVYTPNGYRVIGGLWNERTSLRIHGANDTIWGPILVP